MEATAEGFRAARNGFLDVVRTIAVLRVVVWHAFGAPWLSYLVASIPAMFFVTGALLDASMSRRPAHQVVADRVRRLVVPLWVFAVAALTAVSLGSAAAGTADLTAGERLAWFVPFVDPPDAAWEAGWLSTPLWYLRAFLWLLLAAPVLRWLFDRLGRASLLLPLAGVGVLEWVAAHPGWPLASPQGWGWPLADFFLYSTFLLAGFAYRRGRLLPPDPLLRAGVAVVAGGAAAAWVAWWPPPQGVVNNSHVALLLVGTTWLAAGLAVEQPLARLARTRRIGTVVRVVSARSLTVYLWHTTGLALTYVALERLAADGVLELPRFTTAPLVLAGAAVTTLVAILAVGWVEDLANRRRAAWWPAPRPRAADRSRHRIGRAAVVSGALAGLAIVATAVVPAGGRSPIEAALTGPVTAAGRTDPASAIGAGAGAGDDTELVSAGRVVRPPTPSQRPRPHGWTAAGAAPSSTGNGGPASGSSRAVSSAAAIRNAAPASPLEHQLQLALEQWRQDWGVEGVVAGVERPGTVRWVGASGRDPRTGGPMTADRQFTTYSITKSFVGAIVMQLVEEGRLGLDDPLPPIAALGEVAGLEQLSVRMLLGHTSGLVDYHELPGLAALAPGEPMPSDAAVVTEALGVGLGDGTPTYSGTNYLLLGLLIEEVTGRPLATELQRRVAGPLGLGRTLLGEPDPGSIGGAAGGVRSTIDDLLRWTDALLRRRVVVGETALTEMTAIDPTSDFGLGLWGFCPCTLDEEGGHHYASVGHVGAQEVFRYHAARDTTVVFHLSESIWDRDGVEASLAELLVELVAPSGDPTALDAAAVDGGEYSAEDAAAAAATDPATVAGDPATDPAAAASGVETEGGVEGGDGGFELVATDDAAGADG